MNGTLDITLEHGATQFLLMAVQPTIEIDGYPQKRPWGRHMIEMYPGQHRLRVWFDWMGQSGTAELMLGIWSGLSTFMVLRLVLVGWRALSGRWLVPGTA